MRLSKHCELALEILLICAARPGHLVKTRDAALVADTTAGYASVVANQLVRAGMLSSSRGQHGGLLLARDAGAITIGEVARLFPNASLAAGNRAINPALRHLLAEVKDAVFLRLDTTTIADLLDRREDGSPRTEAASATAPIPLRRILRETPVLDPALDPVQTTAKTGTA